MAAPARPYRILLGGDTSFAESYAPKTAARRGYRHSLERLAPLLRRADYAVVNLETPLTDLRTPPFAARDYQHWSDRTRAPAALKAAGVDAVGLANNHTMDFGVPGLQQTLDTLARHRLASFGAGRNAAEASAPLLHNVRLSGGRRATVALIGMFEYRRPYADTYGFYAGPEKPGANLLSLDRFAAQVAFLKARNENLLIVPFVHWGKNYAWRSRTQRDLGRALIDRGADLVVGHHGHTVQEVEFYRDRWILYGIGNFMFNAGGRYADHPDVLPLSVAVDLAFADGPAPSLRLYPLQSNNRVTGYQPGPANEAETLRLATSLRDRADAATAERLTRGFDEIGPFIELG